MVGIDDIGCNRSDFSTGVFQYGTIPGGGEWWQLPRKHICVVIGCPKASERSDQPATDILVGGIDGDFGGFDV